MGGVVGGGKERGVGVGKRWMRAQGKGGEGKEERGVE